MDEERSLSASITFGPLSVELSAYGHGYSPDLVNDVLHQLQQSFGEAMRVAVDTGAWPVLEVVADDEDE